MTGFYSSLYHFIKIMQNKMTNVYFHKPSSIGICFFIHVLMSTAYTNLANTLLISFPSKNSDLSSMLEA